MKQIHVFISHSWANSNHYDNLWGFFAGAWTQNGEAIKFVDHSATLQSPIDAVNEEDLRSNLGMIVVFAHVVIVPLGAYIADSKWIQHEIKVAKAANCPILAVRLPDEPEGSKLVTDSCDLVVDMNREAVVAGAVTLYEKSPWKGYTVGPTKEAT